MARKFRNVTMAILVCCLTAGILLPGSTAQDSNRSKTGARTAQTKSSPVQEDSTSAKSKSVAGQASEAKANSSKKSETARLAGAAAESTRSSSSNNLRLPRYFSGIVDQQQRDQIHAIQLEYRTKIAELEEELNRTRQDELQALERVLTDSQRKLLEKKRAQSNSKLSDPSRSELESM